MENGWETKLKKRSRRFAEEEIKKALFNEGPEEQSARIEWK
jgi:hypothetical protein